MRKLFSVTLLAALGLAGLCVPAAAQDTNGGETPPPVVDQATPDTPVAGPAVEQDRLAAEALAAGDPGAAEEHLRLALEFEPTAGRWLELINLLAGTPGRQAALEEAWTRLLADFPGDPATHLANGDRLYAAGSLAAAAEAYNRGARTAPRDARFPHRAGNCCYGLGDFTEAARYYNTSLELEFNPRVVANLAGAHDAAGNAQRARDTWQHYQERYPQDAGLVLWYGTFLADRGEFDAALKQYIRGQFLEPENDEFHNRAGLCLFQLGRIAEAADEVRRAIELRPDPLYYTNLTVALETLGDNAATDAAYREALARFPGNTALMEAHARFLRESGEGTAALERLRALAEQDGTSESLAAVGRQAMDLGEDEMAAMAFEEALAAAPNDARLNVDYALVLARLNRDDDLLGHMRAASQSLGRADYHWIIDEVASYWLDQYDYRHGAGVMERIIAQDPGAGVAYNGLAMFLHMLDDSPAALAAVKRGLNDAGDSYFGRYLEVYLTSVVYGVAEARELAPGIIEHPGADADGYLLFLDLFTGEWDGDNLARIANDGLEKNPQSAELLERLVTILYNDGNIAGVIEVLSDRRYATVDWPLRHELLGHCYLETGQYVKAAAELNRAVELSGDNAALWALLGQTEYFIGRYADARSALTWALALDHTEANAHLWLGFTLLAEGDATGAAVSFDDADAVEYPPMDLPAWLALGRAMLALEARDIPLAQRHLADAQVYQLESPRFGEMLAEAKTQAGL